MVEKKEKKGAGQDPDSEAIGEMAKTTRFIMSHRRAGYKADANRMKKSRDSFEAGFDKVMASSVDILANNVKSSEDKRGLKIFDADYMDVNKMKQDLSSETIIEPLITRKVQVASPFDTSLSSVQPQGGGEALRFELNHQGIQVSGIKVTVNFSRVNDPLESSALSKDTDNKGTVVFDYDNAVWKPVSATFIPKSGFWPQLTMNPTAKEKVELNELPKTGPSSWWHNAIGLYAYEKNLGNGIRIGIVDTGVGPHPYLDHVTSIGAFIDSQYLSDPKEGLDVSDHGTHVSGIIAARPAENSGEYAGIVPGAEVYMARVFAKGRSATQGDISYAIDTLAGEYGVHLINMSLGSSKPSKIERDAIEYAMECGSLCICAAGNGYGRSVSYPAAYPETVAVNSLGLPGMYPGDSISASFYPSEQDKYSSSTPFYLASYSNIGKEIVCCAPGTGIISTVPAYKGQKAPYLAMDGTSMASPVATATLASCLAAIPQYRQMPADESRFYFAAQIAAAKSANSLNLIPMYQGYGIINR